MEKYIGITIGPIIKTLSKAKHTRELWAASYFFSNIMKMILEEIKKTHATEVILPHTQNTSGLILFGAGLFPDRIIYKVKSDSDFEDCGKIVNSTKLTIAQKIASEAKVEYDNTEVENSLTNYLKIYALDIEVKENAILEVNSALDALELQDGLLQKDFKKTVDTTSETPAKLNPLENYFDRINSTHLKNSVFSNQVNLGKYKDLTDGNFPNVMDIATVEHSEKHRVDKNLRDKDSDIFLKAWKDVVGSDFKFRNKYICIVHADGDNIGKTIKALKSQSAINNFSQALFNFSINSAKTISNFGGKPIYIGGDDLLFLCPVVGLNQQSFLSLLTDLDQNFLTAMDNVPESKSVEKSPSLSFGVSITYYKFPLYEALNLSRNQLFNEVKSKMDDYDKNAIAIKLQKHSGQVFDLVISKKSIIHTLKMYDRIINLVNQQLDKPQMLNTMIYKLNEAEILLHSALSSLPNRIDYSALPTNYKKNRLDGFFENFFNEPIHKKAANQLYIQNIKQLLIDIYFDHQQIFKKTDNVLNQFYNALRIIHFIQQEDSNE